MFQGRRKTGETNIQLQKAKERILTELSKTVKELQKHVLNTGCFEITKNNDQALYLTTIIEAIFLHGHQNALSISSLFNKSSISSGVLPTPDFWPILEPCTHKDVLHQITYLSHVTTLVGKCRAWIRLALNDGLIESYFYAIQSDKKKLSQQYCDKSLLRDEEAVSIMMNHFLGLTELSFDLNYNTPSLNQWTAPSLQLSGAWQPANIPDATIAVHRPGTYSSPSFRPAKITNVVESRHLHENTEQVPSTAIARKTEGTKPAPLKNQEEFSKNETENETAKGNIAMDVKMQVTTDTSSLEDKTHADTNQPTNSEEQDLPSPRVKEDPPTPVNRPIGNQLGMSCGWSSSFEVEPVTATTADASDVAPQVSPIKQNVSFHGMLSAYQVSGTKIFEATDPDGQQLTTGAQVQEIEEDDFQSFSQEILNLKKADFEIIGVPSSPEESSLQKRNLALMATATDIAREKGLNYQDYKCGGCARPIGMIYGQYKVCNYDGSYHCYECHLDDEHVIPARVIHNWDLGKYKVAKHTKLFLMQMDEEPVYHIDEINPTLYNVIVEMSKTKALRVQLKHLKGYVMTCRNSSIAKDVTRRMWPREYLWDDIHQYSLLDLIQVNSKQLQHHLKKIISFCKKHVYGCESCCQKGFVCEICKNPKILYAFEVNYTSQCSCCHAVFHKQCKFAEQCPRCLRRLSRQQRSELATKSDDKLDYIF